MSKEKIISTNFIFVCNYYKIDYEKAINNKYIYEMYIKQKRNTNSFLFIGCLLEQFNKSHLDNDISSYYKQYKKLYN
jgi:hypothetical protein